MLRFTLFLAVQLAAIGTAQAGDDFIYFKTPSNNIHCAWYDVGEGPEVRCDIRNYTPSFKRPSDCEQDWGFAFAVGTKSYRGAVLCAGDTVISPDARVLPYGQTFSQGGLSCLSETSGMTCKNRKSHGFALSRAKQRVF
jgi:hypothetical protein